MNVIWHSLYWQVDIAACFCRRDYNSIEHQAKNWRMCVNYSSVEYDSTTAEDGWAGNGPGNNITDGIIHIYLLWLV